MSNIKLSIIVPVYNSANYIQNTIESILNQSIKDIEIILINDGSTDNSAEILNKYNNLYSRINVIHQENKGVSATRNLGISIASGEYIGFVDSDDLIDSNMYEVMYSKATEYDCDIVCCGYIEEDLSGNTYRFYDYPYDDIILKNDDIKSKFVDTLNTKLETLGGGSMCTKIYKKSFINKNNILIDENITVGEDLCFNIKAFYHANIVAGINQRLYHYMSINPNSIMTKLDDNKFFKFIAGRMWILKTLDEYNFKSQNYTEFEYARNFANLIQIVEYKVLNNNSLLSKYESSLKILKSVDIKSSINNINSKYLSKNLQFLKKLLQLKLYSIVFLIIYVRCIIKNK